MNLGLVMILVFPVIILDSARQHPNAWPLPSPVSVREDNGMHVFSVIRQAQSPGWAPLWSPGATDTQPS